MTARSEVIDQVARRRLQESELHDTVTSRTQYYSSISVTIKQVSGSKTGFSIIGIAVEDLPVSRHVHVSGSKTCRHISGHKSANNLEVQYLPVKPVSQSVQTTWQYSTSRQTSVTAESAWQ